MPTKQKFASQSKKLWIFAAAVLAAVILVVAFILLRPSERSVTAYCEVYEEENAKLADAQGDTYAVAVFDHKSSDPGDFAAAFSNLERVAPDDDIRADTETLRQVFQRIEDDPAQGLGASLSGLSAEANVKDWLDGRCQY